MEVRRFEDEMRMVGHTYGAALKRRGQVDWRVQAMITDPYISSRLTFGGIIVGLGGEAETI